MNIPTPKQVQALIDASGLSIPQAAEAAGITKATLYRYLRGGNMTVDNLRRVLEVVTRDQILQF